MFESTSRPVPTDPASRSFHSFLAVALLDEWDHLRRAPRVRHDVATGPLASLIERAGRAPEPEHPFDTILRTCGFLQPPTDINDRNMLELVDIARTDQLAARIAVHRILPALVAVARRRGPIEGGAQRAFDDVVACAWIAIRTYPSERRPRKVVSNLVRDAEYLAFVRARRLRASDERVGLPSGTGAVATIHGIDEQASRGSFTDAVELLASARTGMPAEDVEFATAWLNGADTVELARRLDCCERTVRNRRREVVYRLRQAALAA